MSNYLNPNAEIFQMDRNSSVYVDKSLIIEKLNNYVCTADRFVCVSRPRRFGKTMTANMIAAYYERGLDSDELFHGLKITNLSSYEKYKNVFDVIKITMQEFLSRTSDIDGLIKVLTNDVLSEFDEAGYKTVPEKGLAWNLEKYKEKNNRQIVIIIDEWDCIFREFPNDHEAQKKYLDFLRLFLKDRPYVALCYMTGILPIRKYGTQSELNMFQEISMEDPGEFSEFTGFTEEEVEDLCQKFNMDISECRHWYDGYYFNDNIHIYNPRSIVLAMRKKKYADYWNRTETYEILKVYIDMNFDGLKDAIIVLLSGGREKIDIGSFQNDMSSMKSADDVLALLVHLGYLGYDSETYEVFIPNKELSLEFVRSISSGSSWESVASSIKASEELLQNTWSENEDYVAQQIEKEHLNTSYLQYNDENALSYTISLAYYTARDYYTIIREMPTGKGFADIIFVPRKNHLDKPAMIIELKWDKSVDTALNQIYENNYPEALSEFKGNILLVGINYDKKSKAHSCKIERA